MKRISTIEELQEALSEEELHPPEATLSDLNKNKFYIGNNILIRIFTVNKKR